MQKPAPKKKQFPRTLAIIVGLVIVIATIGLLAWHSYSTTGKTVDKKKPVSAGQNTKGELSTPSPAVSSTRQTTNTKVNAGTSATLLTPSGDFVSAHHVSLDTSLVSVCNTTSGATCAINFTNGSQTLSLATQMTDAGGSTYWNSWTPRSLSLTPGTWSIQAVANLNGQTKSASDALQLVVSQ